MEAVQADLTWKAHEMRSACTERVNPQSSRMLPIIQETNAISLESVVWKDDKNRCHHKQQMKDG
jgi:hypothetical protein